MKTKTFEYKIKKQLGNSHSINGFMARCKNYPLRKAMVNHDHDRIKSRGRREISNEVNGELLKGERDGRLDWEQRGNNRVCVSLVLLTDRTAGNAVLYEGGETWPPEVPVQDCFGMKDPHMSRERRGVNGVEQGRTSQGGYKHAITKIKMSIIERPVQEGGVSEQG